MVVQSPKMDSLGFNSASTSLNADREPLQRTASIRARVSTLLVGGQASLACNDQNRVLGSRFGHGPFNGSMSICH